MSWVMKIRWDWHCTWDVSGFTILMFSCVIWWLGFLPAFLIHICSTLCSSLWHHLMFTWQESVIYLLSPPLHDYFAFPSTCEYKEPLSILVNMKNYHMDISRKPISKVFCREFEVSEFLGHISLSPMYSPTPKMLMELVPCK